MTSNIILYIITRNKKTGGYEILSRDSLLLEPLISEIVPNKSIYDQCQELYNKYVPSYSNDYNIFTFLEIDITDSLDIIYFCFAPFEIKTADSYFLPITQNEILQKHIRKILNVV